MEEIQIVTNPSGRCHCKKCSKLIKDNQVEIIKSSFQGRLNYAKYHQDCALKEFIKLFPNLNTKKFNQLKKEILREGILAELKQNAE